MQQGTLVIGWVGPALSAILLAAFDIFVTEEFLDGADVIAAFEQVRSKAMPERVRADRLDNLGKARRFAHGFLKTAGVHVVAMRAA
jgi:hypothetical protein